MAVCHHLGLFELNATRRGSFPAQFYVTECSSSTLSKIIKASKLFNNLPETIRNCKLQNFFKNLKEFFKKQSTKRLVSFTVIGFS